MQRTTKKKVAILCIERFGKVGKYLQEIYGLESREICCKVCEHACRGFHVWADKPFTPDMKRESTYTHIHTYIYIYIYTAMVLYIHTHTHTHTLTAQHFVKSQSCGAAPINRTFSCSSALTPSPRPPQPFWMIARSPVTWIQQYCSNTSRSTFGMNSISVSPSIPSRLQESLWSAWQGHRQPRSQTR
jgi:hypothetical protein